MVKGSGLIERKFSDNNEWEAMLLQDITSYTEFRILNSPSKKQTN